MPNLYDITTETLRRDVIDFVVLNDSMSAEEIADDLDWYYDDVVAVLQQLRDEGLVCNLAGEGRNDIFGDYENEGTHDVVYPIHWRWCGGPVSEALRVA